MTTRKYSSRSQQTTLSAALTSSATSATVVSGSSLLGGVTVSAGETFTVVIDPDTALEEIVDVTAVSTNTLTITRGIDGSTAQAHSAGAVVRHMAVGRDYREANTHIESTTGHGATGAVVGTTNTQTLTNKTLTSPVITTPTIDGVTFQEAVEDVVGAMVSSNTESGIAVTYDDTAGKLNFDVNDPTITLSGDVTGSATMTNLGNTTITTTIPVGTIVDADINSAAAIAKTKISGTAITAADTGTVTSTMIADGTIVDADINASAAIAKTKLALTGTITSSDIANDTIVDGDINTAANIAWTKIAPSSTVSATELGYLDGVTSAIQTQIDSKLATSTAASTYAPLASPALTGVPTAPTAAANTNTTQIATTAYVQTEINDLIAAAPGALDTLNELAASLGNDASFSTTVTNSLATKLPLAGGTMSGAIAMGTNKITGLGTPTASTDATTKAYVDGVLVAPSNLTGPITSVGSATSVASQTGTGSTFVMNTSPTLVTPALGVATATSVNGTTIPTSKTLVVTTDKLSALAATTSAELAGVISDETGTGALVFANTPTLVTPVLGDATASSLTVTSSTVPTNGLYLPTTNTLGLATNSTSVMQISSTGAVSIGGTPSANVTLYLQKNITGSTSGYGIYMNEVIQSDVTSILYGIRTLFSTVASAFTLNSAIHFRPEGITLGAGSAITNQFGFYVPSNLTTATNNYGYYSEIAAATNRWNTYMAGTAANYFAGRTGIGATLTSGAMAQVVNTTAADIGFIIKGAASQTGDLLSIQNSAGTVLAKFDSSGNLGIGTTALTTAGGYGSITLDGTNGSLWSAKVAGTEIFRIQPTATVTTINGIANIPLLFNTNNTERMRIAAGGDVSISSATASNVNGLRYVDIYNQDGTTSASGAIIRLITQQAGSASLTSVDMVKYKNGTFAIQNNDTAGTLTLGTGTGSDFTIDSSGNTTINSIADATTSTGAVGAGYMGLPQVQVTSGGRTLVAGDAGKHIYMTTTSGQTITIPANSSVAFPVGTTITIVNANGISTSIAITTDALRLAGTTSTGTRTLASNGVCTLIKIASTEWISSGNGLT